MNVRIAVDNYKLGVFRKNLGDAGYTWSTSASEVAGVSNMIIEDIDTDEELKNLQSVVIDSNMEAKRRKRH